jgi:Domain of unknown function (DUF4251)
MIFEPYKLNYIAMKKFIFLLSLVFLFSACSSTKEMSSTRADNRKLKKLAEQAEIKKAVESRKFFIRVNRLNTMGGGTWYLVPSSNFLILNGEIASISLGYMGRSFGIHRITGINLNGHTINYKMESNDTKGVYKIQMTVIYGSDKFDVYLTIGNSGTCTISINNAYIQTVSYTGNLIPFADAGNDSAEKRGQM